MKKPVQVQEDEREEDEEDDEEKEQRDALLRTPCGHNAPLTGRKDRRPVLL